MHKKYSPKGALLIEALIAVTVLAVGVVACLRVFSGALIVSDHSEKIDQTHQLLEDQFFGWFLDPSNFNPDSVSLLPDSDQKTNLTHRLSLEKLQPVKSEDENQKESKAENAMVPSNVSNSIEFYQASFQVTSRNQKPIFQNTFYLAQYGKPKN